MQNSKKKKKEKEIQNFKKVGVGKTEDDDRKGNQRSGEIREGGKMEEVEQKIIIAD